MTIIAPRSLFLLSILGLILFACTQPASSQNPVPTPANGTGTQWSDPITWGGTLPDTNSAVVIPAGKTITLDRSTRVASLTVEGTLVAANQNLELTANWIMLHGSGKFSVGTATQPFDKRFVIQLAGTNPNEKIMGMGTKFLGTMGGTLELYGQNKRSWTHLNASALQGATELSLEDSLDGWQVGDEIAVAPSDFDALQAEKRSITAIAGQTITLDRPLEFDHWGQAPQMYGNQTLDMRAEVGNLSRNIVIKSIDNQERTLPGFNPEAFDAQGKQNGDGQRLESGRFGGHMMFMTGSTVRLQNIEVTGLGQQGMLGRYPVHWHLNQDTSSGSFIQNSSIHDTFQRGVVIHQSNGVKADNNVIFNLPGHAVFLEDGVERNNILTNNLVMQVGYVLRKHRLSLKDGDSDRAERQAGFWLTNPQNTVRGNVVAGVENGWGYILADVRTDKIPVIAKTVAEFATNSYLLEFKDNVAHSINFIGNPVDGGKSVFNLGYAPEEAGSCFRFDQRGIIGSQAATISGITAYKCRNAAFWSTNFKPILNSIVADSRAVVINNQGEPDTTQLSDSVAIARTANNPSNRTTLEYGPFPGPTLYEFLESGPVQLNNVLISGEFANNDNSTPAVNAPAPSSNAGYRLNLGAPVYLAANSSTTLSIGVDRSGGYNGPISVRLEIPKQPNLAADNPYYTVTSDPLTIAAGSNSGVLTLRNQEHPKSGDGQVLLVAEGNATVVHAVPLNTSTAAIAYANASNGNNVARLFSNTANPRNPALSAMEFNRAGTFAVDGDINTYAHASGVPLAWWQIDLEKRYTLKEIRLRSNGTQSFGNVWVMAADFPVFSNQMTLAEALALPENLVWRSEINGSIGNPSTIVLPNASTARFVRIWAKQLGELTIPEVELISQ